MEVVLRAVLLGEVPRQLQAPAGTQQDLLEMALQTPRPPRADRRTNLINQCCASPRTGRLTSPSGRFFFDGAKRNHRMPRAGRAREHPPKWNLPPRRISLYWLFQPWL